MPDQEQRSPLTFEQRFDAIMEAIAVSTAAFDVLMEALAMNLELLHLDVLQTFAEVRAITANIDKLGARMDHLTRVVQVAAETVNRLPLPA